MFDAVVIGGGMSGLTAGIRLAHFNHSVCLLEKHSVLGGLNSFYKYKKYLFDVGLHALTNYDSGSNRNAPLPRVLRQLRIRREDLQLAPQKGSAICFPQARLEFGNDPRVLEESIASLFPDSIDGFRKLVALIQSYDDTRLDAPWVSTRETLATYLPDSLLVEMLLCPIMYYGSAESGDMDFLQYVILFKSIYLEGFCRPEGGIRPLIRLLQKRFRELGGDLRLRTGVRRLTHDGDRVQRVELENGEVILARYVLSCAGYDETMRLAGLWEPAQAHLQERLGFMESISVLTEPPAALGLCDTILFYSNQVPFQFRRPRGLTDSLSGVVCLPDNYESSKPLKYNLLRITCLANYEAWKALDRPTYLKEKENWHQEALRQISPYVPDFSGKIVLTDIFSPLTVEKFTGHLQGAVYGNPFKRRDGRTPLQNLVICGTDQGYLGVVGSMLSGIMMANMHVLPNLN